MTTPASGEISMTDINSELDLLTPAENMRLKSDFYNTANTDLRLLKCNIFNYPWKDILAEIDKRIDKL